MSHCCMVNHWKLVPTHRSVTVKKHNKITSSSFSEHIHTDSVFRHAKKHEYSVLTSMFDSHWEWRQFSCYRVDWQSMDMRASATVARRHDNLYTVHIIWLVDMKQKYNPKANSWQKRCCDEPKYFQTGVYCVAFSSGNSYYNLSHLFTRVSIFRYVFVFAEFDEKRGTLRQLVSEPVCTGLC